MKPGPGAAYARLAFLCIAAMSVLARAQEVPVPPEADVQVESPYPAWLPKYEIDIDASCLPGLASVQQAVTWTNPASRPTSEIVFHAYARHRPTPAQLGVYKRTMESFRIDPRISIDEEGRRIHLRQVTCEGAPLEYCWDPEKDTVLSVKLPRDVAPGESITLEMQYDLDVGEFHYRLGAWKGVTNLLNWYPIVAYFGDEGWIAPPFVGWHQPWLNEAGEYDVKVRARATEEVVASGQLLEAHSDDDTTKTLHFTGTGIRDFSIVISKRHEVHEADCNGVHVSVHAFPEHRFYAKQMLQTAAECLERYSRMIGPYPYPELKIVESHFGWNGNETTGMVLIDERVFDAPTLGFKYVDHLVSHEILHQWFYAAVGTDGYCQTWLDEAIVSHLTECRIRDKYGESVDLLDMPNCLRWMPNIDYSNFMHSGYALYRSRGGKGKVLAPLKEMGNVHYLFFLAYDRGSRVVRMINARMGDERFYAFLSHLYLKYRYRVIFVEDFQRELEDFTGQSWEEFLHDWLETNKISDWKVANVDVAREGDEYRTTVRVRQLGDIPEPVNIVMDTASAGSAVAVRLDPDSMPPDANKPDQWVVTFTSAERPTQVEIDPERQSLDANPVNNRWKMRPSIRLTPLYTPLDEVPLTRPLDRPSFVMGPSVDSEGRVGVRGSWMLPNRYRISPFLAYPLTPNDDVFAGGVESELMNFPLPNLSLISRYERTISTNLFDLPLDQGEIALRWNQLYTTSFFYPNLMYTDVYFRFGDNFFPDENFRPPDNPEAEIYRNVRAVGLRYHVDSRMPYWNPDQGLAFDATFEQGFHWLGDGESYTRGFGQVSFVRRLPDGLGYLSETRLATRLRGGVGSPDNGEHFHFGGPLSFRGQRSEDTEGSAFWLTGCDWRFPIIKEMDRELFDNVAHWQSLYGAILYDVGESYILRQSQGLDHAIGAGLYFDIGLFSFVDRVTLRLEYAYSLRFDSDILWLGVFHAF